MGSILTYLIIAIALYFLIVTVKFVRVLLIVILGVIYFPINKLYMHVQKWYFGMKHKDIIVYYAFTPFYWLLVAITYIISAPYEFISTLGIH